MKEAYDKAYQKSKEEGFNFEPVLERHGTSQKPHFHSMIGPLSFHRMDHHHYTFPEDQWRGWGSTTVVHP